MAQHEACSCKQIFSQPPQPPTLPIVGLSLQTDIPSSTVASYTAHSGLVLQTDIQPTNVASYTAHSGPVLQTDIQPTNVASYTAHSGPVPANRYSVNHCGPLHCL